MKGLFQSRDGTAIYYETAGKGRPLIFCYGLMCRRDHWRRQLPHFESRYQIVQFDYRGHQRSALPRNDRNLTLEWCAKDIQDLMNFLNLEEAVCLGHSVGVPVLTHLAVMEPERVKGNVFLCGYVNNPFEKMLFTHRLDPLFELTSKFNEFAPEVADTVWKKLTSTKNPIWEFMASQFGFNPQVARAEDIRGYMEGVQDTPTQTFFHLMRDYRAVDRRPLLEQSKIPTLVIAGEEDCITPFAVQEKMAKMLPMGELEKIPGGSHNAHMDFPELVNERIDAFLRKLGYVS